MRDLLRAGYRVIGLDQRGHYIDLGDLGEVPFGPDLIFRAVDLPDLAIHVPGNALEVDAALRASLGEHPATGRFRDRVAEALWRRLSLADPELVRAGAAVMALPQNTALGARLMWETADTIWTGIGDSSDDVNWWTKRATLSSVWGAVVLYWLGDLSEGRADTRAFIDRRIDDVMRFEKFKAGARKLPGVAALTDLATGWIRKPAPAPAPGFYRGKA